MSRLSAPDPADRPPTSAQTPPGIVTPPVEVDPTEVPRDGARLPGAGAPPPIHHERRRRAVGWQSKDILRTVALTVGLYVLLRMLWFANQLVLATFLGVLFGLAVSSGVDRLHRLRIPRGVAAGLIVVAFYGALAGFGFLMAPTIREQGMELRSRSTGSRSGSTAAPAC
jgi:hypothetical protein